MISGHIINDTCIQNEINLKDVAPTFFEVTRMQSTIIFPNFSPASMALVGFAGAFAVYPKINTILSTILSSDIRLSLDPIIFWLKNLGKHRGDLKINDRGKQE